jgi:NAD(P)-dependent dehydrogenase (short-subunit alcohol dehydrogenase family)
VAAASGSTVREGGASVSPTGDLGEPVPRKGASLAAVQEPQLEPEVPDAGNLEGRIAIVTGGGWNIGRAIALAIARAGAVVIVVSRNLGNLEETVALARHQDLRVRCLAADLTDPGSVGRVFDDVLGKEGRVDILACFAGGYGAAQPVAESDPQEWISVVLRNLYATYLCCRAALPGMLQCRRGDILTCAGGGAFFPMADVHATAYASAKAANCRFTDQLYAEHMKVPGIRINCVEPGMTLSPRDLARIEEEERLRGVVHPAREFNHPPEDAAELVMFLLSSAARGLNGRILSVDEEWWRDLAKVRQVIASDLYRLRRTFLA